MSWWPMPSPASHRRMPCSSAHARMKRGRGALAAVVIEREHDALGLEHAGAAHGVKIIDGHGNRSVGAHGAIDAAEGDVTGAQIATAFGGEDLLADGLAR